MKFLFKRRQNKKKINREVLKFHSRQLEKNKTKTTIVYNLDLEDFKIYLNNCLNLTNELTYLLRSVKQQGQLRLMFITELCLINKRVMQTKQKIENHNYNDLTLLILFQIKQDLRALDAIYQTCTFAIDKYSMYFFRESLQLEQFFAENKTFRLSDF